MLSCSTPEASSHVILAFAPAKSITTGSVGRHEPSVDSGGGTGGGEGGDGGEGGSGGDGDCRNCPSAVGVELGPELGAMDGPALGAMDGVADGAEDGTAVTFTVSTTFWGGSAVSTVTPSSWEIAGRDELAMLASSVFTLEDSSSDAVETTAVTLTDADSTVRAILSASTPTRIANFDLKPCSSKSSTVPDTVYDCVTVRTTANPGDSGGSGGVSGGADGDVIVGVADGAADGVADGAEVIVGVADEAADGVADGAEVIVGVADEAADGVADGAEDGASVGAGVGAGVTGSPSSSRRRCRPAPDTVVTSDASAACRRQTKANTPRMDTPVAVTCIEEGEVRYIGAGWCV